MWFMIENPNNEVFMMKEVSLL